MPPETDETTAPAGDEAAPDAQPVYCADLPSGLPITAAMPQAIYVYPGVPAWIAPAFERLRPLFALEDWYIWLVLDPRLETEGKVMTVEYEAEALQARVRINPTVDGGVSGRRIVLHECWHLAFTPMTHAVEELAEGLPKPLASYALRIMIAAEEVVVERLVRRLGPLFEHLLGEENA